jgi:polar amino acid transport system substrate-binding protein
MKQKHAGRWQASVLAAIVVAAGSSGTGQAASLQEIKQRGYMVVAVAAETSPFASVAAGKRKGFDAELLAKLKHSAPFEIREKPVPAAALAASLRNGDIDAIASSIEITPARQQNLAFTAPFAEATLYYLKRGDDKSIKSIGDLATRPLGIRTGSAAFAALSEVEHLIVKASNKPLGKPIEFTGEDEAAQALQDRKIDYFIDEIVDLTDLAKRKHKQVAIGEPVAHETYVAWAVAKDNADLGQWLDGFAREVRAHGKLAALQQKYLGRRFVDLPDHVTAENWWTARKDHPVLPVPSVKDPD